MNRLLPLHLIVVAAGASRRFGDRDKLLCQLNGRPVLAWALSRLTPAISGRIVVVAPPGRVAEFRAAAAPFIAGFSAIWCEGGACRFASVRNGIAALGEDATGNVAIHDAARPLASPELLRRLFDAARDADGALPGKPVADTLWRVGADGALEETVTRDGVFAVETPQLFRLDAWRAAAARFPDDAPTDDAGLLRRAGFRIALARNPDFNFKLTVPEDLPRINQFLNEEK